MNRETVTAAYEKTIQDIGWLNARSRPFGERFKKYPGRTLYYGLLDRIHAVRHKRIAPMKTFWGAPVRMLLPTYRSVLYHGIIDGHELPFEEYFVRHIRPSDVFFDVGANVGFYSLLARDLGATVHSFEPTPSTFAILKQNVPQGAVLVNKALSLQNGTAPFRDEGIASGTNTLLVQKGAPGSIEVETITLDTYCSEHTIHPTIIKIDAEGADLDVLKGGREMLANYHPAIVMETISDEIIQFLQSLDYVMRDLDDNADSKFKPKVFEKK